MVTRRGSLLFVVSALGLAGCPAEPGKTSVSQAPPPAKKTAAKTTPSGPSPTASPSPDGKTTKTAAPKTLVKTRKKPRPIPLFKRPVRVPTGVPTATSEKTEETSKEPKTSKAGPKIDLAQRVRAPARLRLGPGAKVGWKGRQETRGPGYRGVTWTAIVGQEGNVWWVEHVPYSLQAYAGLTPDAEKSILGLRVSKIDGTVIKAVIGKAGETGKPIRVLELPNEERKPAPAAKRVELKLSGGQVLPAQLREETLEGFGTVRRWTGVGPLAGVLLKSVDPKHTQQLTAPPTVESLKIGDVELPVRRCVYDDGDVTVVSDHPVVKSLFGGVVSTKSGETTVSVTAIATDAKPLLDWTED